MTEHFSLYNLCAPTTASSIIVAVRSFSEMRMLVAVSVARYFRRLNVDIVVI